MNNTTPAASSQASSGIAFEAAKNSGLFSFQGRIGRGAFALTCLTLGLIAMAAVVPLSLLVNSSALSQVSEGGQGTFSAIHWGIFIVLIPVTWIQFAAMSKRWHDLGQSAWLCLLAAVPVVNFLVFLYLLFAPSKFGANLVGELPTPIPSPALENAQRKRNSLPQRDPASSMPFEGPATVMTAATPSKVQSGPPVNQVPVTNSDPHEQFWAEALAEFEGAARRPGLWARSFALSNGDEAVAKATYLHQRANELSQLFNAKLEGDLRQAESKKIADSIAQSVAHLAEERRTYALSPKGICPNCGIAVLPLDAHNCHKCKAMFGYSANWKVIPTSESDQIDVLKAAFSAGKKVDIDDVIFLAKASSADPAIAQIYNHYRDSLLHLAAKFDLPHEASLLIANGANVGALNVDGKRPFEVAENSEFRRILSEACADPIT